jgi:hypothetical protein
MRVIRARVFDDGPEQHRQVIANFTLENCSFDRSAGLSPNCENADRSQTRLTTASSFQRIGVYGISRTKVRDKLIRDFTTEASAGSAAPSPQARRPKSPIDQHRESHALFDRRGVLRRS